MLKDFTKDFNFILDKLKKRENFAFTRFSDGELFMLQNKTVVLADNYYVTGEIKGPNRYTQEEHKEFHPDKHQKYRDKLIECYKHNQNHYYKGICTTTDGHVGRENFKWMIDFHGGDHKNLTFANLLINANYSRFVEEMIPVLAERHILYVVNELADLSLLPFEIEKAFLVGSNCQVNNYDTAQKVVEYIEENKLEDTVIMCSAATLSNYVIYEGFKKSSNNTFLDIGSCLNPLLGLEGWKYTRGYLTGYWLNSNNPFQNQVDRWN